MLIVSADVAGGHDAASAALKLQIRSLYPHAEVSTMNGLAAMGSTMHHIVRDGYQQQLLHARWSYRALFRCCDLRATNYLIHRLMPSLFGSRMLQEIGNTSPDLIISTYPLCTSVLGGLRRSERLHIPVVALITDVHPHRMWFAPGIDKHLVCAPGDVQRASRSVPWANVTPIRPPTHPRFDHVANQRASARHALCLPSAGSIILITGGAWGVGSIPHLVHALDQPNRTIVVACGHNEQLRLKLLQFNTEATLLPIAFTSRMHDYMHAADLVVATGAGLTVFEAIMAQVPVVMASAIPGHGIRSARALDGDGLATFARYRRNMNDAVMDALTNPASAEYDRVRSGLIALPLAGVAVAMVPHSPTCALQPREDQSLLVAKSMTS